MTDFVALELARRKAAASLAIFRIFCVLVAFGAGIMIFSLTSKDLFMSISGTLIVYVLLFEWVKQSRLKEFRARFKRDVIKRIATELNLDYASDKYVDIGDFSVIYDMQPDRYFGDDLLSGVIDGVGVKFSDVRAGIISQGSHGEEYEFDLFCGVLFVADFPKRLNCAVRVNFKGALNLRTYGEMAKMDDSEFSRLFDVYTTDQVTVRYALTPMLMQRFCRLFGRFDRPINAVLMGKKIYIAIHTGRDSFEPDVTRPLVGSTKLDYYKAEITGFLGIVQELKLNRKIWTN